MKRLTVRHHDGIACIARVVPLIGRGGYKFWSCRSLDTLRLRVCWIRMLCTVVVSDVAAEMQCHGRASLLQATDFVFRNVYRQGVSRAAHYLITLLVHHFYTQNWRYSALAATCVPPSHYSINNGDWLPPLNTPDTPLLVVEAYWLFDSPPKFCPRTFFPQAHHFLFGQQPASKGAVTKRNRCTFEAVH